MTMAITIIAVRVEKRFMLCKCLLINFSI
jgi:hypothetical protein